ncbi:O-methyltransferase [Vreelandella titanicae]|uniref:O-methyltransferase n=1 Tax=Vreelandella titanicae TaxID=664683 RepID=A0AAP9NK28_9GAMM|nr:MULTISPECIES: O-methyltransferase [Halomonas]QKS23199.1 Putative O-methyltransferase [Halomonas titanicae]UEQ06103.1 O-methyltransferase [Halomonas profundus]CDG55602.1 O-methyltransferase mdmC [Halomonas sp. A3H3]SDI43069.1 Predicted O-methyltransferase YrrM [Halomonas titanicae]
MSETLQELLTELEQFGQQNDAAISERPRRMLNITRDTGEFLSVLVQATNAQRVLEIGTSNGYSTLWLAQAVQRVGGHVTTVELSEYKLEMAARNFERSGLSDVITQQRGEVGGLLESLDDACFDLLFLDSKRSDYVNWWPNIQRVLRKGGLLVVDNATSHADEMADFMALVSADPDFTTCTVPVGNGEFLATRCGG